MGEDSEMNKYEVILYETQFNTLLYEVEAKSEKDAIDLELASSREKLQKLLG